jgi:inosose dehydratase
MVCSAPPRVIDYINPVESRRRDLVLADRDPVLEPFRRPVRHEQPLPIRRPPATPAALSAGSSSGAGPTEATTRQPARRRLARSPIGVVPITWNNVDLTDLAPEVPAATVLDACAELGFDGVQLGRGFPLGDELQAQLRARNLRLAEVYAELPVTEDGPTDDALEIGRERLALLHDAGGDVLVAACRLGGGRERWAARGDDPPLPASPSRAGSASSTSSGSSPRKRARPAGPSRSTPTPARSSRRRPRSGGSQRRRTRPALRSASTPATRPSAAADAVALVAELGSRIRHVHVKDVDPAVLADLRTGRLPDFAAAIRARVFTELGRGLLDVDGLVGALDAIGYGGWLMLEQDSTWLAPAESLRIGRAALLEALAR